MRRSFLCVALLLGAALAIPVGMLLGPGIAGIAVVVIAGVLVSGWHRLGDQSAQVTLTALFALLLGGHQPVYYVTHRMVDLGIGFYELQYPGLSSPVTLTAQAVVRTQ